MFLTDVYGKDMPYYCSPFENGNIFSLHESGHTIAEIAEETGRHYTTVARWVRRFEEGEDGIPQRSRSGRAPGTSAQ